MSEDLGSFKQLIKEHCGLQLEGLAEDRLRKALLAAATTAGVKHLKDFLNLLRKDDDLVKELITHLTVNETYFFRENGQIELLIEQLLPRLFQLYGQKRPLRILSAGCSSGEEPYSLVIALQEAWGQASSWLFQVEGGDLDRKILQKARKGVYSPFSFRGVPESLRKAYFQPEGSHFQLNSAIRSRVSFHELNLLAPEFPAHLKDYDVIFFRNVSIYFDMETRQTILQKLHSLLHPEGIVVVGSSETLANDLGVFKLVEEKGYYYFVKGEALLPPDSVKLARQTRVKPIQASVPAEPKKPPQVAPHGQPFNTGEAQVQTPKLEEIRQLLIQQETGLASRQLDLLLSKNAKLQEALLLKAWILGNKREFPKAEALVEEYLQAEPWSVDANFLKGLLFKWQNKWKEAINAFRKVVYIQPDSWPAHFYLAEACRYDQQKDSAFRAYKSAQRLLSSDSEVATGLKLLPLEVPRSDLLFLTEHQLLRLRQDLTTSHQGRE